MNQRQKHTLIAAIVALLGIILILGVVWTVTKENRFNRYHNKRGGFTMSYPATWAYQEDVGGAAVIFFAPKANDLDFFQENVNIVVEDISGRSANTLASYSKLAVEQMEAVFGENFEIYESGPGLLGIRTAYKLIFLGKGPGTEFKYMSVWTIEGSTAYQVTYTAVASQFDLYLPKMKRMVRSFRID